MIEIVCPPVFASRSDIHRVLNNLLCGARASGERAAIVRELGSPDLAVVWGAGNPIVQGLMREAKERGVRVIAWDAGYWRRAEYWRCSVDDAHPQAAVMARNLPPDRWKRLAIPLRNEWCNKGHVLLIGMGRKCAAMYGEPPGHWEKETAKAVKRLFPERKLWFRPRPTADRAIDYLPDWATKSNGSIEQFLKGASLVVCRHSNVAVDAIVAGIPVVAMNGAASAVCPNQLEDAGAPLADDVRRQFLANLAYFQWTLAEMREASTWAILKDMAGAFPEEEAA